MSPPMGTLSKPNIVFDWANFLLEPFVFSSATSIVCTKRPLEKFHLQLVHHILLGPLCLLLSLYSQWAMQYQECKTKAISQACCFWIGWPLGLYGNLQGSFTLFSFFGHFVLARWVMSSSSFQVCRFLVTPTADQLALKPTKCILAIQGGSVQSVPESPALIDMSKLFGISPQILKKKKSFIN